MKGPKTLSQDLPLKFGVPIGQVINFADVRVTVVNAYPGQVRCLFEEVKLDGNGWSLGLTGSSRVKTVSRAEYDKWIASTTPKTAAPIPVPEPFDGRSVKIMRMTPDNQVVFEDASFESITEGALFIVFESNGVEVPGGPWLARSSAYRDNDNGGCWTIDCDAVDIDAVDIDTEPGDPDLVV